MSKSDITGKDVNQVSMKPEGAGNRQEMRPSDSPAPQGYPQQQGYAQQPYIPQPRLQRSGKLNVGALILAICFTVAIALQIFLSLFGFSFGGGIIAGLIPPLLNIAAGVLLIIGVQLRSKTGNILFAVALFVFSFSILIRMLGSKVDLNVISHVISIITVLAAGVSGITYLVSKKPFDSVKLILMIIMVVAVIAQGIIGFITDTGINFFFHVLISILYILPYATLGICAILFKPSKQR